MKLTKPLVILDLETTGTWIEKDKVIEIAMIKLLPTGGREVYAKRINPGMTIPPVVVELTGISNEAVKDAPAFKEVAKEIVDFLRDADIGGFNVDKFDVPLLEREIRDAGLSLSMNARSIYDAQKVFHLNEKRDLTAAYAFYCGGKKLEGAHAALADTEATLEVMEGQIQKYGAGEDTIDVLGRFNYVERQEFYDSDRKFRWWNGELYMMFGKYAKKESLREIARKDPGYLEWMLGKDFSEDIKALVEGALKGRLPKYEAPKVVGEHG
ncbi:MAG: 3'-5' exonuclease [Candidatus Omnitrophica bacterium]|nr:3'-5' exonuclease [Candidatus Omnitrophota bacterium]